ncbi:hypothetical protein [Novosphingobium sp. SG707]|uniref:hypothetical protein n=1 Tax=Novosphingobium sp. SG707 TaxID=2586996 RepID=UPI0014459AD8|nr:hypothetical protein [Novosphingobium sp. SG707]NKI99698.1 hypothetical protein [Novosphingobium sp. SG707]
MEDVIRDRFLGRQRRVLLKDDIEHLVAASMAALAPLKLLYPRTSGASRLGVPPMPNALRSTTGQFLARWLPSGRS